MPKNNIYEITNWKRKQNKPPTIKTDIKQEQNSTAERMSIIKCKEGEITKKKLPAVTNDSYRIDDGWRRRKTHIVNCGLGIQYGTQNSKHSICG